MLNMLIYIKYAVICQLFHLHAWRFYAPLHAALEALHPQYAWT
jgi:hypothetical protein